MPTSHIHPLPLDLPAIFTIRGKDRSALVYALPHKSMRSFVQVTAASLALVMLMLMFACLCWYIFCWLCWYRLVILFAHGFSVQIGGSIIACVLCWCGRLCGTVCSFVGNKQSNSPRTLSTISTAQGIIACQILSKSFKMNASAICSRNLPTQPPKICAACTIL